jgi:hypothetical protein
MYIGVIAMVLKLFSIGSVVLGPMLGILIEAGIAEIVLTVFGQPRRLSFVLAGALGVLWTLAQPFFTGIVLFGRDIFVIWLDMLDQGSRLFGINPAAAFWILLVLGILHLGLGAAAGWLAWGSGRLLRARLDGAFLLPSGS